MFRFFKIHHCFLINFTQSRLSANGRQVTDNFNLSVKIAFLYSLSIRKRRSIFNFGGGLYLDGTIVFLLEKYPAEQINRLLIVG
jgi:hypothetical protein